MKREASAKWQGDGKSGNGAITTQSGVLSNQPYSFNTRFVSEDGKAGTNPEELIAAAHAGCFTMALAFQLAGAGFTADVLDTRAVVEAQKLDSGFAITSIALTLKAKIPNITPDKFQELAKTAKENCPVSKALSAVPITLQADLG